MEKKADRDDLCIVMDSYDDNQSVINNISIEDAFLDFKYFLQNLDNLDFNFYDRLKEKYVMIDDIRVWLPSDYENKYYHNIISLLLSIKQKRIHFTIQSQDESEKTQLLFDIIKETLNNVKSHHEMTPFLKKIIFFTITRFLSIGEIEKTMADYFIRILSDTIDDDIDTESKIYTINLEFSVITQSWLFGILNVENENFKEIKKISNLNITEALLQLKNLIKGDEMENEKLNMLEFILKNYANVPSIYCKIH